MGTTEKTYMFYIPSCVVWYLFPKSDTHANDDLQTPCYLLNSKPKDYTTTEMSPLRYCHNRGSMFKQVTLPLHKRMQGEECLTAAFSILFHI